MNNNHAQWQAEKKSLFAHADPSLAIQSMKSVNTHLHETRNILHTSLDRITNIKTGILNTSSNLQGTSSMYTDYDDKLKKSQLYLGQLKKKQASNARKIKMAFGFLILVVCFVLVRRVVFPDFYRWT